MTDLPPGQTIEIVRGEIAPEREEQLLGFWAQHGVLDGEEAQRRLSA